MTDIRTIGVALHGPRWMRPLARDLKVDKRTVQRWAAGAIVPPKVIAELLAIADARISELKKARD